MIRKSGNRFSEEIMLKQRDKTMIRFNLIGSWSDGRIIPRWQLQIRGARQFAPAFADFFALRDLALTDFCEDAGLMLRGLPEATGVTTGAASGSLKYTRQPGVSCDLFLIMQAVTRSTSGISGPQRRNASPLHACSSSWV